MKKTLESFILITALLLCGCSAVRPAPLEIGSSAAAATMEGQTMCYEPKTITFITDSLGCTEKSACMILETMRQSGIDLSTLQQAQKLHTDEGFLAQITAGNQLYELQMNSRYHVYAIRDLKTSQYIYAEYQ